MGAPNVVRGGSHSGNIAAADLAREGCLDVLSSDYVPGALLLAAFMLPEIAGIALPEAIGTVTARPARAARLSDRGSIEAGRRADLVRVRMHGDMPVVKGVWREGRRVS
jgi:alpha-D-ribose 1-methylphosphonate 5-triphosphate diphosphatase